MKNHFAGGGRSCIGCGKIFHAKRSKTPTKSRKSNPPTPGVQRIGRMQKAFYLRDQGAVPGPYVHTFTRRAAGLWTHPPGWYHFKTNVAVIR